MLVMWFRLPFAVNMILSVPSIILCILSLIIIIKSLLVSFFVQLWQELCELISKNPDKVIILTSYSQTPRKGHPLRYRHLIISDSCFSLSLSLHLMFKVRKILCFE